MKDKRYWIWLSLALGEGARFKEIIDDFGSVENLYNSNILERKMSTALTSKQIDSLERVNLNDTEQIIIDCENNGWDIITYEDEKYPERLKQISNPPAVLYVDGELPDIDNNVCIGVVGTRKASSYAQTVTHIMSKAIGLCGTVVVSGGALGVDSSAHRGAIEANAKTIAVLGCGLGTNYLMSNKNLRNQIKENGALVTEFIPFSNATKYTFPLRNRIISGLSLGVLVVEAGVKSGSLITARYACEQNRDIYAIPSSIIDFNFSGSNKLIDDGATVVTRPEILIERYAQQYSTLDMSKIKTIKELMYDDSDKGANIPHNSQQYDFDKIVQDRKQQVKNNEQIISLSSDERLVYDAMSKSFEHIDEIATRCSLSSSKVLTALTMLEIKGIVQSTSGKRYKLN